jgi:2-polyprenyl-3-methyl-5-hydroxy-6-metoxy-1,4-benzoquinol methylase
MQITTGVRALLSYPFIYSIFQHLMGAKKGRLNFINENVRPETGDLILDIGCGPADLLDYLPEVNYSGFDVSEAYIAKAKKKYGGRGKFYLKELSFQALKTMPKFDLVIASGLLHHLDDIEASNIMRLGFEALKPSGRMITIDPCYVSNQNPIARLLISKDRGQNVRDQAGYENLARIFSNVKVNIKHKSWIPFSHCIMECTR